MAEKTNTIGYEAVEEAVAHTPWGSLPKWIQRGVLPQMTPEEWAELRGQMKPDDDEIDS